MPIAVMTVSSLYLSAVLKIKEPEACNFINPGGIKRSIDAPDLNDLVLLSIAKIFVSSPSFSEV